MKPACMLLAVCSSFILFAACKKTDEPNTNNNNNNGNNNNLSAKAQLLVNGKWQIFASTAFVNYMGKDTTADLYAEMDECDKDDFILFSADGKATIDENTNKCPGDQQIETATWVLLANDTRLALIDSNPDTFDVNITNTLFTITHKGLNTSGDTITYTDSYKNIK